MDEDQAAAVTLAEREEELRVGARALTRRLKDMEARAAALQLGLENVGSGPLAVGRRWKILDDLEALNDDIRSARWGLYELTANALGTDYNAADVALWCGRALEMGAQHPRLDQTLLMDLVHVRKVPNEPFRARLGVLLGQRGYTEPDLKSPFIVKAHQVLAAIEEERGGRYGAASLMYGRIPQTRVFDRWLGLATTVDGDSGRLLLRLFVGYEQAEALAHALDMTPHQAGI